MLKSPAPAAQLLDSGTEIHLESGVVEEDLGRSLQQKVVLSAHGARGGLLVGFEY